MRSRLKTYLKNRKNRCASPEGLQNLNREELHELITRLEQEIVEANEKISLKNVEAQKVKDDIESYKGTVTQLQQALQSSVKECTQLKNKQAQHQLQDIEHQNNLNQKEINKQKGIQEEIKAENEKLVIQNQALCAKLKMVEDQEGGDTGNTGMQEKVNLFKELDEVKVLNLQMERSIQALEAQKQEFEEQNLSYQEQIQKYIKEIQQLKEGNVNKKNTYDEDSDTLIPDLKKLKTDYRSLQFQHEENIQILSETRSELQKSNELLPEMQSRIQKLEHELELKQSKHNNELYRQKQYYKDTISELKDEISTFKERGEDEYKIDDLTVQMEEMRIIKEKLDTANDELKCEKRQIEFQNQKLGGQIKEFENQIKILTKKLETSENKREQAKNEVIKLSEKLEQNVREHTTELHSGSSSLKSTRPPAYESPGLRMHSQPSSNSQIIQQSQNVPPLHLPSSDTPTIIAFKKQFEVLYKDLLKMVMTAPTALMQQDNTKPKINANTNIEEKHKTKRSSSVSNNRNTEIIFQIPAEEFSKYERKYNNTLAQITEFLDSQNLAPQPQSHPKQSCSANNTPRTSTSVLSSAVNRIQQQMQQTSGSSFFLGCIPSTDRGRRRKMTSGSCSQRGNGDGGQRLRSGSLQPKQPPLARGVFNS